MKEITIFLLVILLFLWTQLYIASLNPCSQFNEHPEKCTSDGPILPRYKKL